VNVCFCLCLCVEEEDIITKRCMTVKGDVCVFGLRNPRATFVFFSLFFLLAGSRGCESMYT